MSTEDRMVTYLKARLAHVGGDIARMEGETAQLRAVQVALQDALDARENQIEKDRSTAGTK